MAKIQDKVRVAPILVPSAGMERQSYASLSGGAFWLSSKSKHASQASALMADYFTTKEFSKGGRGELGGPDGSERCRRCQCSPCLQDVDRLVCRHGVPGPSPVVKNASTAQVVGEMHDVKPDYSAIVLGIFTGDLPDAGKAFKKLSDGLEAERERAIKVVTGKGHKVSVDDWALPDWNSHCGL